MVPVFVDKKKVFKECSNYEKCFPDLNKMTEFMNRILLKSKK